MENVTDALKIAFAVFVFILGLGVAMHMFSLARQTSEFVLQTADRTKYYSYETVEVDDEGNRKTVLRTVDGVEITTLDNNLSEYRIVGLETIIPTIYKYSKENYAISFYDRNGELKLYRSPADGTWKNALDIDSEIARHEPWTGSIENINSFLNTILNGDDSALLSGGSFPNGLIKKINDDNLKFEEHVGKSEEALSGNKTTSKRYITYVLCN